MMDLKYHLRLDGDVAKAPNLTHLFPDEDLTCIGECVWDDYAEDETSRGDWSRRTQAAMDLAMQVVQAKSFPWANCANVTFPLVTIAALQFHAQAYPALVSGKEVVKCRVPAPDPTGELVSRAYRVGCFLSDQVMEQDQSWEEGHDRLLLQVPIVGCVFKKSRWSPAEGHPVTECVTAQDLVMHYYAKSVESAARKTQVLQLHRNEVHSRCLSGLWRDITEEPWFEEDAPAFVRPEDQDSDSRKGAVPPTSSCDTPFTFLEQHRLLDLDKDGYAEPYIVTIEASTHCVVRIVARWESEGDVERTVGGKVIRIRPTEYYTKYELIPSPDGGVYGIGFGALLGPMNESVNSLVNMILDAGTLATAAGGFLSRGVKIRGGVFQFSPFEWNRVDSTGDDLRKGLVELPVREPSTVLFQLLSFLVNYAQRVSGSTDAVAGENPGQNTPAQTQQSMIEQGKMIYSALFKRIWRSMKEEFKKLYLLNARHLPISKPFAGGMIAREDFLGDPSEIRPAADPNVTSSHQRIVQAAAVADRARVVPGYAPGVAERRFLEAMQVDAVSNLFPGPQAFPPPTDPKVAQIQAKADADIAVLQAQAEVDKLEWVANLLETQRVNNSKIAQLTAQAELYKAQAATEDDGKAIAIIDALIGAVKQRNESIQLHIDKVMRVLEHSREVRALDIAQQQADAATAKAKAGASA